MLCFKLDIPGINRGKETMRLKRMCICTSRISNGVAAPLIASGALHWCLGVACLLWHEKDAKEHRYLNCRALVLFLARAIAPRPMIQADSEIQAAGWARTCNYRMKQHLERVWAHAWPWGMMNMAHIAAKAKRNCLITRVFIRSLETCLIILHMGFLGNGVCLQFL